MEFQMKMTTAFKALLLIFVSLFTIQTFAASSSNDVVTAIQDTAITGYIKAKIAMDKNISATDADVTTNNGKVTLSGTVNSDVDASNLIQLAQSTSGVNEVDATNLNIKGSKQPFTDLAITAKIKGLFVREKLFSEKDVAVMSIHVETKNGVVYLTGTSQNEKEINNANALAKSVKGVSKVISTVTVVKTS